MRLFRSERLCLSSQLTKTHWSSNWNPLKCYKSAHDGLIGLSRSSCLLTSRTAAYFKHPITPYRSSSCSLLSFLFSTHAAILVCRIPAMVRYHCIRYSSEADVCIFHEVRGKFLSSPLTNLDPHRLPVSSLERKGRHRPIHGRGIPRPGRCLPQARQQQGLNRQRLYVRCAAQQICLEALTGIPLIVRIVRRRTQSR